MNVHLFAKVDRESSPGSQLDYLDSFSGVLTYVIHFIVLIVSLFSFFFLHRAHALRADQPNVRAVRLTRVES
jgi:hypothetical protein